MSDHECCFYQTKLPSISSPNMIRRFSCASVELPFPRALLMIAVFLFWIWSIRRSMVFATIKCRTKTFFSWPRRWTRSMACLERDWWNYRKHLPYSLFCCWIPPAIHLQRQDENRFSTCKTEHLPWIRNLQSWAAPCISNWSWRGV